MPKARKKQRHRRDEVNEELLNVITGANEVYIESGIPVLVLAINGRPIPFLIGMRVMSRLDYLLGELLVKANPPREGV